MTLKQVRADLVLSEYIRDQMEHHKPLSETARLDSTGSQRSLRNAISIIESLGFVIAKEEDGDE